jgi:hypothetical protein
MQLSSRYYIFLFSTAKGKRPERGINPPYALSITCQPFSLHITLGVIAQAQDKSFPSRAVWIL